MATPVEPDKKRQKLEPNALENTERGPQTVTNSAGAPPDQIDRDFRRLFSAGGDSVLANCCLF